MFHVLYSVGAHVIRHKYFLSSSFLLSAKKLCHGESSQSAFFMLDVMEEKGARGGRREEFRVSKGSVMGVLKGRRGNKEEEQHLLAQTSASKWGRVGL